LLGGNRSWQAHEVTIMNNKSYCRFRNITPDISDCEDAIEELFNGVTDDGQPLSDDELRAATQLIRSCISIVALVADNANVTVDLDVIETHLDTVLRNANRADLEARFDARDARILLSNTAK